jgi:exopolysaccharide biosynthesis polyprenyl glycosylphosphotransferase
MAQIQDFVPRNARSARWGDATAPDASHGEPAQPAGWVRLQAAGTGVTVNPGIRTKLRGLRLGERRLLYGLGDWLVLTGGSFLILSNSEREYGTASMMISLAVVSVLWFFFADAFDAYSALVMPTRFNNVYSAAKVLVFTGLAYTLFAWLTGGFLPVIRPRISETFISALVIVPMATIRLFFTVALNHAPMRRQVAVVGANRSGYEMVEALSEYGGETYEFVGYFDDAPHLSRADNKINACDVLPASELARVSVEHGIDQIVLANPVQTRSLLNMLSICHERGIQVTPMFALYQDLTGRVPVSHLGRHWFVAMPAHVRTTARTYLIIKRLMDIVIAALVLLGALVIGPIIALAIRLDSPGPIFFIQTRVGRGGRPFKIVKFRSMKQNAEAKLGAVWATDDDPRITRVGRALRRSRLDEIPQMWNVLVGDMSIVGPRPERPEFEEKLEREIPFYRARRAVQPGLTGWAQVRHGYGNTMHDALRKVEYDLYYIKNESLYLDLLIILRTVAVVLKLGGT